MRLTIISVLLLYIFNTANAQYETIVFDYEKSTFNENQPLPSEVNLMFTGAVSPQITLVEIEIFKGNPPPMANNPLHKTIWKKPFGHTSSTFFLPSNFKLKSRQQYNFSISYYRNLVSSEKEALRKDMYELLDSYVDMTYTISKKKISLRGKNKFIMRELNSIVESALSLYRNRNEMSFKGFSDLVELKLDYIDDLKLSKSSIVMAGEEGNEMDKRNRMRNQQLNQLKEMLHNEVDQYLNMDWMIMVEVKNIYEYPTEKTGNTIGLNAGYAASLFDFDFDDLDYGSTPYVGISIPLGNRVFKSSFLSNSSLSFGLLLTNMEDNDGNTVRGPFIDRPLYAGYGYRVFKFIRLNLGATLLEFDKPSGKDIAVRPMIGASIDFNFWLGIGDQSIK